MARTKKDSGEERVFSAGRRWNKDSLASFREYQKDFMKETYQSFVFRCNKETEADIIKQIKKQDNIAGYIKKLISNDIAGVKPPVAHSAFVADELLKLTELKGMGVIDAKEFKALKERLINYKEGK